MFAAVWVQFKQAQFDATTARPVFRQQGRQGVVAIGVVAMDLVEPSPKLQQRIVPGTRYLCKTKYGFEKRNGSGNISDQDIDTEVLKYVSDFNCILRVKFFQGNILFADWMFRARALRDYSTA